MSFKSLLSFLFFSTLAMVLISFQLYCPRPSISKENPSVTFSSPSEVVAGISFPVVVNLSNFDAGSCFVKVRVGGGSGFSDGRTQSDAGGWLADNAKWNSFPAVDVDSSGLGSLTVNAQASDDVVAGDYNVTVRVRQNKKNYDAEVQLISVTVPPSVPEEPESVEDDSQDEGQDTAQEEEPQPKVSFSAPAGAAAGSPFSVTINLSNFEPGMYPVKVLLGSGSKFYDGRTQGPSGKWLAWNASWSEFPSITVGSSGLGSAVVQAKAKDELGAGNYLIKARVYEDFESSAKPFAVSAAAVESAGVSASEGDGSSKESSDSSDAESHDDSLEKESVGESSGDKGEVLGEETSQSNSKLNFYIILGILGALVGSGGLAVALKENGLLGAEKKLGDDKGEVAEDQDQPFLDGDAVLGADEEREGEKADKQGD